MFFFACATTVVLSAVYVLRPLFKEPKGNLEVELLAETELDRLLNRKAIVYSNIKDLEFEYKMGRLSDVDFKRLETGYKSEAAGILRKLDQLGADENVDESIEADIAARRKLRPSPSSPSRTTAARKSGRCPSCGAEVLPGKKFCGDCGQRLQPSDTGSRQ